MTKDFAPDSLDVLAFTRAAGTISRDETLQRFPRLLEETGGAGAERPVHWQATGESRKGSGGAQPWLHIEGQVSLPLVCQRCLLPVDVPVVVDRSFRFVPDEATAEAEDDLVEEDLLALQRDFHLHTLVEDEFVMAVPPVPVHDVCPVQLPTAVQDPDFDAANEEKPNPFAILAQLQKDKAG
jgi:uncharacterized protein